MSGRVPKVQDRGTIAVKLGLQVRQIFSAVLAPSLVWAVALGAGADPGQKRTVMADAPPIKIPNFGKVKDCFYRGSQPKAEQYDQLAALGIKTVVDLRDDTESYARTASERAGLRYTNLPLDDKHAPPPGAATRFLEIINDPANWPVYVHCAGGRHRTGAMTAIYRMSVDGWDVDRAYAEMKHYDFYTGGGHQCFKDYVYDYYRSLQAIAKRRG